MLVEEVFVYCFRSVAVQEVCLLGDSHKSGRAGSTTDHHYYHCAGRPVVAHSIYIYVHIKASSSQTQRVCISLVVSASV